MGLGPWILVDLGGLEAFGGALFLLDLEVLVVLVLADQGDDLLPGLSSLDADGRQNSQLPVLYAGRQVLREVGVGGVVPADGVELLQRRRRVSSGGHGEKDRVDFAVVESDSEFELVVRQLDEQGGIFRESGVVLVGEVELLDVGDDAVEVDDPVFPGALRGARSRRGADLEVEQSRPAQDAPVRLPPPVAPRGARRLAEDAAGGDGLVEVLKVSGVHPLVRRRHEAQHLEELSVRPRTEEAPQHGHPSRPSVVLHEVDRRLELGVMMMM
mmetsp:Transcript_7980/g.26215  ORF Transcript_7980/g.26215 Transcript_7980/m.26215 type:complete len:270 (-) Transcript_7980:83-892(-)